MSKTPSKIEKLIRMLCPDGVQSVKLGEVCEVYDGTHQTPKYTDDGIRFVSVENINALYKSNKYISREEYDRNFKVKPRVNDVFMTRIGSIGACTVIESSEELAYYVTLTLIRPNLTKINSKYIKYIIESTHGQKELRKRTLVNATPIKINLGEIGKIEIPLPPLAVQEEIVKMLNRFTGLEAELKAELEAELEARKKQYKYYRDDLLNIKDVEYKTLGEIGEFIRGNGLQKKDFTETGIGCIHYGQIYTYYGTIAHKTKSFVSPELAKNLKSANQGDVIITNTSENLEDVGKAVVWLGEDEIVTGGHATIFKPQKITGKYFAYYTQTRMFFDEKRKYAKGTKVIDVSATDMAKIKIPVPLHEEQERIVTILDKFDALVNDISIGLPAELNARRKQYEYYRNKLLTFNEYVG